MTELQHEPPFVLPPPLVYMRDVLADYYREHMPAPPARFARREFGFIFWPSRPGPPPFVRHLGFSRRADYERFFQRRVPWHAYYSTAFYQKPVERRMQDKGWMGAELIFDLDADHLPDAAAMSYAEQLRAVKVEFRKLLDEFIFGDFGFTPEQVFLTFSGGRGYHCHVVAEDALRLEAKARRQIADYVTGKGVEERELIRVTTERLKEGGFEKERKRLHLPRPNDPGWRGRIGRSVLQLLEEVRTLPYDKAVDRLTQYDGIGPAKAEEFLARIRGDTRDQAIYDRIETGPGRLGIPLRDRIGGYDRLERIAKGLSDQGNAVTRFLSKEAVHKGVVELAEGETDEPVTADVKRLIRLPDSLHGKSGLRVVPLEVDDLATFDPLVDAVALPVDVLDVVVAPKAVTLEVMGERFRIPENDPTPLPRAAAFFAVSRRLAIPAPLNAR